MDFQTYEIINILRLHAQISPLSSAKTQIQRRLVKNPEAYVLHAHINTQSYVKTQIRCRLVKFLRIDAHIKKNLLHCKGTNWTHQIPIPDLRRCQNSIVSVDVLHLFMYVCMYIHIYLYAHTKTYIRE